MRQPVGLQTFKDANKHTRSLPSGKTERDAIHVYVQSRICIHSFAWCMRSRACHTRDVRFGTLYEAQVVTQIWYDTEICDKEKERETGAPALNGGAHKLTGVIQYWVHWRRTCFTTASSSMAWLKKLGGRSSKIGLRCFSLTALAPKKNSNKQVRQQI